MLPLVLVKHTLLFPSSRTCFHVVKAGTILVPAPTTGTVSSATIVVLITGRIHANYDMEMQYAYISLKKKMKSVLLQQTSSSNDRSKLKALYTDVLS